MKVEKVEEYKVEKILNKRKVRRVIKYLVQWKEFMIEHDSWKKEKDLENIKKTVEEFKRRVNKIIKEVG